MQLFQFLFVLLCSLTLVQDSSGQEQNVSAMGQQQNISATEGDVVPQFGLGSIFGGIGKGLASIGGWAVGQIGSQLGLHFLGG
ncbi:unnamed protein product [Cylicocyclus nassatus]|uniref:Uncharacterized protein n=1 Tax=Cylicocyclus nassatus TaxID=53992 RepID=A0AA36M629_CYLNA|nr:unnamed protein product [Cylicocyclus nassatus]